MTHAWGSLADWVNWETIRTARHVFWSHFKKVVDVVTKEMISFAYTRTKRYLPWIRTLPTATIPCDRYFINNSISDTHFTVWLLKNISFVPRPPPRRIPGWEGGLAIQNYFSETSKSIHCPERKITLLKPNTNLTDYNPYPHMANTHSHKHSIHHSTI